MNKIKVKFSKDFIVFISLRILYSLIAVAFYTQFARSLADADTLVKGELDLNTLKYGSPFRWSTLITQLILQTLLPNSTFFGTIVLTLVTSIIFWTQLRKYLTLNNSLLIWITIFAPGFSLWTCIPSKEAVFISISLIYICFEVNNITYKPIREWNKLDLILKRLLFILIFFFARGYASLPYFLLGLGILLFPFLSNFFKKFKTNNKISFTLLTLSFLIAVIVIFVISKFNLDFFSAMATGLKGAFLDRGGNLSREFLADRNPFELRNFIIMPYLSIFPTIDELLNNKALILLLVDSLLFVGLYFFIWSKILTLKTINPKSSKFLQFIFLSITISYLLVYGITGSYNLGTSLRFRQNFVNIGQIFPLLLYYNYKNKESLKYVDSNKKN